MSQARQGTLGDAPVSPAFDLAALQDQQRNSLAQLRLWWRDWAVTLRPSYNGREQLELALTVPGPRGAAIEDDDAEPEPGV